MATIITLGPRNTGYEAVTFEEAFGEFSNAKGKGRARRLARKQDRIAKRKEKKVSRIAARNEVKSMRQNAHLDRKQNRQVRRAENKNLRKDTRLQGRMDRKLYKANTRAQLEQMNAAPEDTSEEYGYEDQGYGQSYDDGSGYVDQGYYDQGQAGYVDPNDPYYDQGGYYDEPGYGDPNAGYVGNGSGGGYYDDGSGYYGEEEYDMGNDDQYYGGEEGEGDWMGEEGGYIEDYGGGYENLPFDGVMGAEDRFSEMNDGGDEPFSPFAEELATNVEWNKEMVERLKKRRANGDSNGAISQKMLKHQKRVKELNDKLDNYANCAGEYMSADGENGPTARRRKSEVMGARRRAKAKRRGIGQPRPTLVDQNLDAQFNKQRIEVPAQSNATGTGLNGLDLQDDFDAPRVREITLGADGSTSGKRTISIGYVLLGAVIIIGTGYILEKKGILKFK